MPETPVPPLKRAPIVEAVVDIFCDLPATINREAFRASAERAFLDRYPKTRLKFLHEQDITFGPSKPAASNVRNILEAVQSFSPDNKQIIQSRPNGFSFNRLAPYSSFDDYLPEIQRCWNIYCSFALPVRVNRIALRYINRILVPADDGRANLKTYLRSAPNLPEGSDMALGLTDFLHQYVMFDRPTENQAKLALATQSQGQEPGFFPIILDIEAFKIVQISPQSWTDLVPIMQALRTLKNRLFSHTLTPECLKLFQ